MLNHTLGILKWNMQINILSGRSNNYSGDIHCFGEDQSKNRES